MLVLRYTMRTRGLNYLKLKTIYTCVQHNVSYDI